MRTTTVVLAIILSILSVYLAFYYYERFDVVQKELHQERYDRYVSEEQLQDKNNKISELTADLGRVQKKFNTIEKLYDESKALNSTLKIRLDNASRESKSLKIRADELEAVILKTGNNDVPE